MRLIALVLFAAPTILLLSACRNSTFLLANNSALSNSNHYSPAENLERLDYQVLSQAHSSIDIAMYSFTDRYLASLLAELASTKHVQMRIYRDGEQFLEESHRGNPITDLFNGLATIHVRIKPTSRKLLMHLKVFVVDPADPHSAILRDGSANWSPAGLKAQDNNARYTSNPTDIRDFESNFNDLWNRANNEILQ